MCELAAIAGCDPEPRSLRELELMAKAADLAKWSRTFAVLAQIFNVNRDPKKSEAIDPLKFCPWVERGERAKAAPPTESERSELKKLFPKKKA